MGAQSGGVAGRGRADAPAEAALQAEQGGGRREREAEPHERPAQLGELRVRHVPAEPPAARANEADRAARRRPRPAGGAPAATRPARLRRRRPLPVSPPAARSDARRARARAHLARVGARRARGAEAARLRLRRSGGGRGIERHPADPLEVDLDPGVGVEVAHPVLAACRGCRSRARTRPPRARGSPTSAAGAPSRPRTAGSSRSCPRTGTPRAGRRRSAAARCSW